MKAEEVQLNVPYTHPKDKGVTIIPYKLLTNNGDKEYFHVRMELTHASGHVEKFNATCVVDDFKHLILK